MMPFAYAAALSAQAAITHVAQTRGPEFVAGGTDMLELLQEGVRAPAELIDINELPLAGLELSRRTRPTRVRTYGHAFAWSI